MFEIRGDWRVAASEPRTWHDIVSEEASSFMIVLQYYSLKKETRDL